MSLFIINDMHIGVQRSAGTTPHSAYMLRKYLWDQLETLLARAGGNDVMVLGDLFDTHDVPAIDVLATYQIFEDWLTNGSQLHSLYLVPGNHDLSKTSTVLSSFTLLAKLLEGQYSDRVFLMDTPDTTEWGYVIPHMPNQDLFNEALKAVPATQFLFLHCNYDNNFAAQSDQSLNLSREQAQALPVENIIIAHEHQTKFAGKVWIPGNQAASSVSDWLGTEAKQMLTIGDDNKIELVTTQNDADWYTTQQWDALRPTHCKFIRVEGHATPEQASDVIAAISRYRQQSDAFVITNAVRIETEDSDDQFSNALESVKAFDVLAALKEILTPEEYAVIEGLK